MWFVFGTAFWVSGFEVCGSGVLLSSAKGCGSFSGNRVVGFRGMCLGTGVFSYIAFRCFLYSNAS